MNLLLNFNFIVLVVTLLSNLVLAFFVYHNNPKSATNKIFTFLSIITTIWLALTIVPESVAGISQNTTLFLIRLSLFFAVPQALLFFFLANTFPNREFGIEKKSLWLILIVSVLIMLFNLSPYVIESVDIKNDVNQTVPGPGMPAFGLFNMSLSIAAVVVLIRRIRKSSGLLKNQLKLILFGIVAILGFIIISVLLPVILFRYNFFASFTPLYTFIFLATISFAIVKYHLFNIKVIAAQALVSVLILVLFFEGLLAQSVPVLLYKLGFAIFVMLLGIFLVRSVKREVEQREQLEILTKKLEKANEQLKILDQARSEFITIASHQLRTPPATIKWYLAAVLDGDYGKFDETVRQQLRKTMSTNNTMIALIDDLLNVSRIERGKMEFIFQPTDLVEITQVTVDQLLPQSEMKKLDLVFQKPKDAFPIITADKEKLRQVINNFIDNAIKYTQKGKIVVELSKTAKDLMMKVTDTGRGVAPDQLKHIFEKFDRGKSPAHNSTGLGLGLYVAKFIVEQHKGKVWVESKGEGKGSSFIFTVPIITANRDNEVFDLTKTQKINK